MRMYPIADVQIHTSVEIHKMVRVGAEDISVLESLRRLNPNSCQLRTRHPAVSWDNETRVRESLDEHFAYPSEATYKTVISWGGERYRKAFSSRDEKISLATSGRIEHS